MGSAYEYGGRYWYGGKKVVFWMLQKNRLSTSSHIRRVGFQAKVSRGARSWPEGLLEADLGDVIDWNQEQQRDDSNGRRGQTITTRNRGLSLLTSRHRRQSFGAVTDFLLTTA